MQLTQLKPVFDKLQKQFGDPKLNSIYGAGCTTSPEVCFVFMNPTGKNVAANLAWNGLRAPWIGTKNVWKLFSRLKLLPNDLFHEIQKRRASDWDPTFALRVYEQIADRRLYITNLSKATQQDARPLPDTVFKKYLPSFFREIEIIRPSKIISFGNQV